MEKTVVVCRAHGTRRMSLFGSFACGDAGPESDVDVLVEFEKPTGLLALVRLEREFSEWLGRPVDLLIEEAISHHLPVAPDTRAWHVACFRKRRALKVSPAAAGEENRCPNLAKKKLISQGCQSLRSIVQLVVP